MDQASTSIIVGSEKITLVAMVDVDQTTELNAQAAEDTREVSDETK